jgi:hypothetical protein
MHCKLQKLLEITWITKGMLRHYKTNCINR